MTQTQIDALVRAYGGRCAYCGRPWAAIDHFVPLARGGSSSIDNLRPACNRCNYSKSAQTLEEWRPWLSFVPPTYRRSVVDRLLKHDPSAAFNELVPRRNFRFPTAGWDGTTTTGRGAEIAGRGFLLLPEVHVDLIERMGGLVLKVSGTTYHRRALQSPGIAAGMAIQLVPDPENPSDPNAVGVWDVWRRRRVGWIPRERAEFVGDAVKANRLTHGIVVWEWRRGRRRVGIEILLWRGRPVPRLYLPSLNGLTLTRMRLE